MREHWKTTIAGLLVVLAEFVKVAAPQYAGVAETLQQVVMGAGLLVAADGVVRARAGGEARVDKTAQSKTED